MPKRRGGLISMVAAGSPAEQAGVQAGDRLMAINGQPLRDTIDYRFYSADEQLDLELERGGQALSIALERSYDADLGIEFSDLVFDGMRLCRNRCPFCFVDQMPPGLRSSLYLHDDDYRYSFLMGNYVTLTNLNEDDWQRIGEQGLSPLYISIHAADLAVRRKVLGNPRAPDVMAQLRRLCELGIMVHGQVVIWPGVNDGALLQDTIQQAAALWPCIASLALVPVGLTDCRPADLRRVLPAEAAAILKMVDTLRAEISATTGSTWLYPADELYLLAGRPVPSARFYDDDAQWQNGVGMVRDLLDDWKRTKRRYKGATLNVARITLGCGELIAPTLARLAAEMHTALGVEVQVIAIPNHLFGSSVTVSGLLSGADVCAALTGRDLGERLYLPAAMFMRDTLITLDDMTIETIAQRLGVPVSLASTLGEVATEILAAPAMLATR